MATPWIVAPSPSPYGFMKRIKCVLRWFWSIIKYYLLQNLKSLACVSMHKTWAKKNHIANANTQTNRTMEFMEIDQILNFVVAADSRKPHLPNRSWFNYWEIVSICFQYKIIQSGRQTWLRVSFTKFLGQTCRKARPPSHLSIQIDAQGHVSLHLLKWGKGKQKINNAGIFATFFFLGRNGTGRFFCICSQSIHRW